jgi:hypothetical protein
MTRKDSHSITNTALSHTQAARKYTASSELHPARTGRKTASGKTLTADILKQNSPGLLHCCLPCCCESLMLGCTIAFLGVPKMHK